MSAVLSWLDRYPQVHFLVAGGLLALVLIRTASSFLRHPAAMDEKRSDWVWGFVILALLVAGRWPTWLIPLDFNSDEGQLLAGAHTLVRDPVFWRSVDGATAGPFDFFALWPAGWILGWDTYATSRVTALLLLAVSLTLAHQCVARLAGVRLARLILLPAVALEALTNSVDLLHYSTELVPVALLATAAYAAVRRWADQGGPAWNAWGALALGAVPLSKLQAAPIAAVFGLCWLGAELQVWKRTGPKHLAYLLASALFPAALFAWQLTLAGEWSTFVSSYLLFNFNYTARGALAPLTLLKEVVTRSGAEDSLLHLWLAGWILGLVCLFRPRRRGAGSAWIFIGAAALASGLALTCILLTGRPFIHYWQLIVVPGSLLLGAVAGNLLATSTAATLKTDRWLVALVAVGLTGGLLVHRARQPSFFVGTLAYFQQHPRSELATHVLGFSRPGDSLAIWGICNRLYVETGLRQGAHDAQFERAVVAGPYREYFRQRFLADVAVLKPALFLDATGSDELAYHAPPFAHDRNYSELAAVIRADYELVDQFSGARIYRRRDLAAR